MSELIIEKPTAMKNPSGSAMPAISVVVPAYNEVDGIESTVQQLQAVGEENDFEGFEIVIVNDGSSDGTLDLLEKIDGISVVSHPTNMGYGRSLKSGILAAQHDIICITDADGTYPISEIPRLTQEFVKGFDLVVGARTGEHYRESIFKAPLRGALRWIVEFTSDSKIDDINSGLRLFRKSTIVEYFPHLCNTFSFTTSMTLSYRMTGRFVIHTPIPYYKRAGKTKVKLLTDSLRTLQYVVQACVYYNPLKIFVLMAALCMGVSVAGQLTALLFKIQTGFWVGIGGFFMALGMLGLGLLAVLLKQIMDK